MHKFANDKECTFQPNSQLQNLATMRCSTPIKLWDRKCSPDPSVVKRFLEESKFSPCVGRAPKTERNPENLPVGHYLYNKGKVGDLAKKIRTKENAKSEWQMTKHSHYLATKKRVEAYIAIFQLLDSDFDGEISAENVDISKLSHKFLKTYSPLLCDMEKSKRTLNRDQFIQAAEKLFHKLTSHEKSEMISFCGCNTFRKVAINHNENLRFQVFVLLIKQIA